MRKGIDRDFNHPSIFAWCLFNETWGFGGQVELVKHFPTGKKQKEVPPPPPEKGISEKLANLASQQWVQEMWELAKGLDPTRLIEDMSVVPWDHLHYYAHGDTDINSWHFYTSDYEKARVHIDQVVRSTYFGSNFNYVEGYQQRGQPLINSEYGGVGALDGNRDVSWSFKFLTNELRRHGEISAYIYTELHDVEWEYNGFLTYDRTPKEFGYPPTIINGGDVLPIDAPPISHRKLGERIRIPVSSSHFARRSREGVILRWDLVGIDRLGKLHSNLASGRAAIAFPQFKVESLPPLEIQLPNASMLCTLHVSAVDKFGEFIASNFVQFLVNNGPLPEREELERSLVLRPSLHRWDESNWTVGRSRRAEAERAGSCYGCDQGWFEWEMPIEPSQLRSAQRIRVLCEASSRHPETPQTHARQRPSVFQMFLNEVRIYEATLPNHPHDARGALSYLRGGYGAYGYLSHATIEGELLSEVRRHGESALRLRCAVPAEGPANGLTVYGESCGRFPVGPTIILES
jgi:hypothetical protein